MSKLSFSSNLIAAVEARNEADRLRTKLYADADEKARRAEEFFSIVKTLNLGAMDQRLETEVGTMEVLRELDEYYKLTGERVMFVFNGRQANGHPQLYFEV